jgi:ferredoxin
MAEVYKRLAKKLDKLPQSFPATESGVELEILRKIFSDKDAETAIHLKPIPETAERISRRLGKSESDTRETLERMKNRGQIQSTTWRGEQRYSLAPFVVGIFEYQLPYMDRELAELCEAYAPHLAETLGGTEPGLARVVPVHQKIDGRTTVLAYEDTRTMIEGARSFRVMDCICRKEKDLVGKPCSHTLETCLTFSRHENAYDDSHLGGRIITKEEALAVLDAAEEEGLVHCTCCCGLMRLLTEYHTPYGLVRSNWETVIDEELCETCGVCANERCPVEAIEETDSGDYEVLSDRCIGCGVCVVTCPSGAMSIKPRPESEHNVPPRNVVDWSVQRAANRSGPVKAMALERFHPPTRNCRGEKGKGEKGTAHPTPYFGFRISDFEFHNHPLLFPSAPFLLFPSACTRCGRVGIPNSEFLIPNLCAAMLVTSIR